MKNDRQVIKDRFFLGSIPPETAYSFAAILNLIFIVAMRYMGIQVAGWLMVPLTALVVVGALGRLPANEDAPE